MQVNTLRILDRFLGMPMCWILTIVRRIENLIRPCTSLPQPKKVLIIKLSEMGSTVLAYPALAELKRNFAEIELFFLVFEKNAAIVGALEIVPRGNLILIDYQNPWKLLTSGLRAMRGMLKLSIDTTIDMDLFSRLTAALAYLVCHGNRVGFDRYNDEGLYRGNLLTHRVLYSPHIHTSAAFVALIRTLLANPSDEPHYRGHVNLEEFSIPSYRPPEQDIESVRQKLVAEGWNAEAAETIILINPNSSDIFPLRKWPIDHYTQLCRDLLKQLPRCALVITGVAGEKNDARYIRDRLQDPRCIDFTGKTSFRELLALYASAAAMVTNDSGPAHFAALLDLPTVVLFGPETPRLYSPIGHRHKALYAHFACSPCVSVYNGKKSSCLENRCLISISPEVVLSEVLACFDPTASSTPTN